LIAALYLNLALGVFFLDLGLLEFRTLRADRVVFHTLEVLALTFSAELFPNYE
jgi:hypothetical protein